jgi:hypothetical protein
VTPAAAAAARSLAWKFERDLRRAIRRLLDEIFNVRPPSTVPRRKGRHERKIAQLEQQAARVARAAQVVDAAERLLPKPAQVAPPAAPLRVLEERPRSGPVELLEERLELIRNAPTRAKIAVEPGAVVVIQRGDGGEALARVLELLPKDMTLVRRIARDGKPLGRRTWVLAPGEVLRRATAGRAPRGGERWFSHEAAIVRDAG